MDFERVNPDEVIDKGKQFLKGSSFKSTALIVIGFLILISLPTVFYTVQPNEVGVVRRFGDFQRITKPGLHFKLPFSMEKVNKVKVKKVFKEEFGFRTRRSGVKTRYSSGRYERESLMLTGDLNILDIGWIVQYKKADAVKYLFNIRDQKKTLRDISESVMREIVGDYSFNEVLKEKRVEINNLAKEKMQDILNSYQSGIVITKVNLRGVNPPDPVKPAFNEVNEAKQEKEQMINEAWQAYNRKIPAAKGQALGMIQEAEGYSQEQINRAQGDAERFELLYSEYKNAKDVTRKRIYLDRMKSIIRRAGKIYIVDPQESGILPLLNLEKNAK